MSEPVIISVRHQYACSPAQLFDAWIDPAVASRWLFRTPEGENVRCEIDPRPGGAFVVTDRRAGEDVEHRGTFSEMEPFRRLVFSFSVPKYSSAVSTVTVLVEPTASGAEMTLVNHDVPAEWASQTEEGWRGLVAGLERIVTPAGGRPFGKG